MKKFSTLVYLGDDCTVHDWKTYVGSVLKNPGTSIPEVKKTGFMKSPTKKVCLVLGEPFYNFEGGELKSLNKRGKNFKEDLSDVIPKGILVKEAKIKEMKRLLALHYGDKWDKNETLGFFRNIFT
ncbi:hypothetical protein PR048_017359 [Dryococelus australis]|uniref:Uncharacterized protein n=1 Tax=Dryococelus australis TaxID=614101 RepID=A0ABQ9H9G2_9NEOP|nr:hypothetical protein PR048_017359 [Dryococelus australis]